ncbi:pre-mRNA-processing factor 17 [Homalodisca vitripennis]|nr:pre-mRNA-processing factor 17 [Homalodisca vitripennis]
MALCSAQFRAAQYALRSAAQLCAFGVDVPLCDYLKSIPPEYAELRLFSDNCSGQNKNHALNRFLLLLTDTGRFSKITMYFPVRGHFLPCDRDFATIKRHVKKFDRIYTDQNQKPTLPPPVCYPAGKVPIKASKINDVRNLLPYVAHEHIDFYEHIMNWPTLDYIAPEVQDD